MQFSFRPITLLCMSEVRTYSPMIRWGVICLMTLLFLAIIGAVVIANMRQSGVTGMDPIEIQKIRYEAGGE